MKKTVAKSAMVQITSEPSVKYPKFDDPCAYAEKLVADLVAFWRKQGLFTTKPDQLKDWQRVVIDLLRDLDRDLSRMKVFRRIGKHDEALFRAINIGWNVALAGMMQFDPVVKYGRPQLQQLTENRKTAIAKRRRENADVWQTIVKLREQNKLTIGQIEQKTGYKRRRIFRALKRHRAETAKK